MSSAFVIADRYSGFVLLQKPRQIITIRKQAAAITHLYHGRIFILLMGFIKSNSKFSEWIRFY